MAINRAQLKKTLTNSLVTAMVSDDVPDDARPPVEKAMRDLSGAIVEGVELYITKNIDLNEQKIKEFEQKILQLQAKVDAAEAAIQGNTTTIASVGGGASGI